MRIIKLNRAGAHPGFCAELFRSEKGGKFQKVIHPKTGGRSWYVCSQDWEPEHQLFNICFFIY